MGPNNTRLSRQRPPIVDSPGELENRYEGKIKRLSQRGILMLGTLRVV